MNSHNLIVEQLVEELVLNNGGCYFNWNSSAKKKLYMLSLNIGRYDLVDAISSNIIPYRYNSEDYWVLHFNPNYYISHKYFILHNSCRIEVIDRKFVTYRISLLLGLFDLI